MRNATERRRLIRATHDARVTGKSDVVLGFDRWRSTRKTDGPFPALAEAGMLCAGRSSDFRVRFLRPSRRDAGSYTGIRGDNGQEIGGPLFTLKNTRLQRRGRPGITPGSLYVGPLTRATDHQRPIQSSWILL